MSEWFEDAVAAPVRSFLRGAPSPGQLWASRCNDLADFHVIAPSTVATGESVRLTLQAWDDYERLVGDYGGSVALSATDPDADLPERVRFPPAAEGVVRTDCRFETPGLHYVTVTDGRGTSATSNPVVVTDGDPDVQVLWGDLHLHSQFSDGAGSMDRGFAFGRDVMDLDVVAYTDHDTMGFFIPPSAQRWLMRTHNLSRIKDAVADHHEPGEFVTLFGYEWTKQPNAGGHVNCYFDGVEGTPFFDSRHPESDTYEKLWRRLEQWRARSDGDVVTIPHHPAEAMYPFDFAATDYDDDLAPLVEIYSQWGSSESPGDSDNPRPIGGIGAGEIGERGHYVRDALAMGHHVGVVAGSDFHGPRPGHSLLHVGPHVPSLTEWVRDGLGWGNVWRVMDEDSYPGGLTAFVAPAVTREAVFDALRGRQVYGTTQPHRILVRFAVNGRRLRDPEHLATVPDADADRRISLWVAGTSPVEAVEIVKNGHVWQRVTPDDDADGLDPDAALAPPEPTADFADHVLAATVRDEAPVTGVRYDDRRGTDEDHYYLRVRETDGGLAWVGPIWVGVD